MMLRPTLQKGAGRVFLQPTANSHAMIKCLPLRYQIPLLLTALAVGCSPETTHPAETTTQKKGPQTTDQIGEFDPEAGQEIVDSTVRVSGNPLTYALEARESALEQVAELPVMQGINLFHAMEGRYPKDHEEFMTKVIRANNIRLPRLAKGKRYQYDVQNHKLVIVQDSTSDGPPESR